MEENSVLLHHQHLTILKRVGDYRNTMHNTIIIRAEYVYVKQLKLN